MSKYLLLFFCMAVIGTANAQTSIRGTVRDTIENKPLRNAVVALVGTDSVLHQFTRTGTDGAFAIRNAKPGAYKILVSFPRFADFVEDVTVKESGAVEMGTIALTLKSKLLQEVVVRSAGAIRIKGDTTEFVADSFVVRKGATVEELLKKLPGFQVNSKGEITAQGQRVQKVLVDGEEFFGNDPTMATQNIAAKAVDKVQVFDNKTEQQQITGMTSGSEGKTVNIKLKEDSKKGAFGKAELGSNFNRLHDAKLLYNRFVGKKKFSAFGTRSNTSTGSLGWQDRQRLGIENDYEYDEISGFYYSFGESGEFDNWNLRGLPTAYTAGALFINKWNEDKHAVNGSYLFNQLATVNRASTLAQTILPDTSFFTNQYTNSDVMVRQHTANFKYEWKLDSLRSIKFVSGASLKTNISDNVTYSESLSEERAPVNQSDRTNLTDATRQQMSNVLTYNQKFKKKDRLLMAVLRHGFVGDDHTNYLKATNRFYKSGLLDEVETIDQQKTNVGNSTTLGGKVTYKEPITEHLSVIADYGYNLNTANSRFNTFDKSTNGKYENLNPLFSNNFEMDVQSHSGSLIARYMSKKMNISVGSGISNTTLDLLNLDNRDKRLYHFLNFTPQAAFRYSPKAQSTLSFNYRGNTRQPSLNQLQPLRNNSDPLNVFVGNPDLKVGFNHNISGFYNSYKMLKQRGIWANVGVNFMQNAITNRVTVDDKGRSLIQPVNISGNHNYYYYLEWNLGEGEKRWIYSLRTNGNGGRNNNFVNGFTNRTDYRNVIGGFGLRYQATDKYMIYLSPEVGYNWSNNSLRPDQKVNYYTYGGNIDGMLMLPGKLELRSECNFDLRQKLDGFAQNTNIIYWNASLARSFFKDKKAKIILQANDILDQNRGFQRTINSYAITDQRYDRVARYVMLKLEYTLNKTPGN
ncbi:TonB-dependent receptor [Pseudocnuella soli]|uniref:TonB-dependent receptor n=1 Tax=Pseudocnuella soli TaxID=2502779 RepID=UPI001047F048|nr:TonB-dependent receptor [Pseudocnuella soli]